MGDLKPPETSEFCLSLVSKKNHGLLPKVNVDFGVNFSRYQRENGWAATLRGGGRRHGVPGGGRAHHLRGAAFSQRAASGGLGAGDGGGSAGHVADGAAERAVFVGRCRGQQGRGCVGAAGLLLAGVGVGVPRAGVQPPGGVWRCRAWVSAQLPRSRRPSPRPSLLAPR